MPVGKRVNQTTNKTQNTNNNGGKVMNNNTQNTNNVNAVVATAPVSQSQPTQPTQPTSEKITMTKEELAKMIADEVAKSMIANQKNEKEGKKEMKKQEEPKAVKTESKKRGRAKKTNAGEETVTMTKEELAKMLAATEAKAKAEAPKAKAKAKAKREAEAATNQLYLSIQSNIQNFFRELNIESNVKQHPADVLRVKKNKITKLSNFDMQTKGSLNLYLHDGQITTQMYNALMKFYGQNFRKVFPWFDQMQLGIRTNLRYVVDGEEIHLNFECAKTCSLFAWMNKNWEFDVPSLNPRFDEKETYNDPDTIKELNDDLHLLMGMYEGIVGEEEAKKIKIYEYKDVKKMSVKDFCEKLVEMATDGILSCELITYFNKVAKSEKDLRNIILWVSVTTVSAVTLWIVVDRAIKNAEKDENWLGENGDEEPAPEDSDVDNCYGESDED